MPDDRSEQLCRCGHARSAHVHYRPGTECSLCSDCRRFRPPAGAVKVVAARLWRQVRDRRR